MAKRNAGTQQPPQHDTFPTFLDHDPYPQAADGRPTTSSSNTTSEFETRSNGHTVPSSTGPVGEPGLPPSRPTSGSTDPRTVSARISLGPPPSRRGLAPYSRDGGSRPGSAVGQTHVPSLPAHGFFRPMSPQALQAQRGQAISPSASSRGQQRQSYVSQSQSQTAPQSTADQEDEDARSNRYSLASVKTERDGRPSLAADDGAPPLPVSRGFSLTSSTGDGNGFRSTIGAGSVMSKNSTTPLHTRQMYDQSKPGSSYANPPPPPKSPISLRASLGLHSRHSSIRNLDRRPTRSHEKLPSNPTSPITPANEKPVFPATNSNAVSKTAGKNYEYYAGNMLFFLSGRCINTKAKPLNVVTCVLTVLPVGLFFGFSAPWLWHHVSPALPIVFAYIFFLTISAFAHAAFSDPGVLPRNLHPHPPNPDEDRDPLTVGPPTTEWVMVRTFPTARKQSSDGSNVESGQPGSTTAMEVPTKYCKSCSIWRPPRAHHCRVCDGCVETQDHHCVWLNNCVGRRNYRFFFGYVGWSSVLAIMLLAFSLVHVGYYASQNHISFASSLGGRTQERVAFAMFIYSVFALPYPASLFLYHLFLVARGETTREYLNSHKFLPKDRHRPFSQRSFFWNWVAVLSRPRPPTYMRFKAYYAPGDTRLGHTTRRKDRAEQARLEAARSGSRVAGMKKRYSVQQGSKKANAPPAHGNENGGGMEMKSLPTTSPIAPTKDEHGRDLAGFGLNNSTPR